MNNKILLAVIVGLLGWIAWLYGSGQHSTTQAGGSPAKAEREVLYWKAPMDPNYRRAEPGKSPMGMDLVPVYADEVDAKPGTVRIDPSVVNNLGVRTAHAKMSALPMQIESVAYVSYDDNQVVQVNSRVDGWIERLWVKAEGDPVTKGEPLYAIYSPALVAAQEEYLAALRYAAESIAAASEQRLLALGADENVVKQIRESGKPERVVTIRAAGTGVVVDLGIREGAFVTPGTRILSFAGTNPLWIQTEVFEKQAAWLDGIEKAELVVDAIPGRRFEAEVDYVYPDLDPVTRTLKVRFTLANDEGLLRPNMFGRVVMRSPDSTPTLSVPREAVIRGGAGDRVVVSVGNDRYRSRLVVAGRETAERTEILQGLEEHDVVVVSGQFLIDSESNIPAALDKYQVPADAEDGHDMSMHVPDAESSEHAGHGNMEH